MRTEGQDSREVRNLLGMNTDSVERHASVSDLRPPRGADACIKSASAEAHAEFAHRLPDAVNKAGTGVRPALSCTVADSAKKPLNVDIQNQFAPAHHICV